MSSTTYPVRVEGHLDAQPSRWLWLVKWLLALPHYFVLVFLWIAFVLLSVVAWFAILATGRYPRAIFDYNVGVLRWTWRVQYYAYGALGTDRYPPFTLRDVPDYPARLDVPYPAHLSRGLALVKWWLLALPHYLVVAVFAGGGAWALDRGDQNQDGLLGTGLIGILVLIAAIALAATGRYPRGIFDLVLGMNRWVLRVCAYAGLMTDEYPPFRLDLGGDDPGGTLTVPRPRPAAPIEQPPRTGPRVLSVVVGALLLLVGVLAAPAGVVLGWMDQHRDGTGYVATGTEPLRTSTAALTTNDVVIHVEGSRWLSDQMGTVRIQVSGAGETPVFVGLAASADVDRWLGGVAHDVVRDVTVRPLDAAYTRHPGRLVQAPAPAAQPFWVEQASGTGAQTLSWSLTAGTWTVVVANADGTPGVDVRAEVAAELPHLGAVAFGLLALGAAALAAGLVLVVKGVRQPPSATAGAEGGAP
jgi:hypothetical protein